jgi:hypothetical protein
MDIPKKMWRTGPNGTLLSEANGFRLIIEQSAAIGHIRFLVLSEPRDEAASPLILASGNKRSALRAMAAAERAASIVGRWPAEMWRRGTKSIAEFSAHPAWEAAALSLGFGDMAIAGFAANEPRSRPELVSDLDQTGAADCRTSASAPSVALRAASPAWRRRSADTCGRT